MMPQRGGGETYAERFRRQKLGRTTHPDDRLGRTVHPADGPTRIGADALPSRQLGGAFIPSNMSNLNPTLGQTAFWGSDYMTDPFGPHWDWRNIGSSERTGNAADVGWNTPSKHGHNLSLALAMEALADRMRVPSPGLGAGAPMGGLTDTGIAPSPGLGAGSPGLVSSSRGVVEYPDNFDDPLMNALQSWLLERFYGDPRVWEGNR